MIVILAQKGIGFPNGTAPTARINCYARGLKACGHQVVVLCLDTSEPSPPEPALNRSISGTTPDDIHYEYTCGSTIRSATFWGRRWTRLRGMLGAVQRIDRQRAVGNIEAILLYSDSYLDAVVAHFVSRRVGAPCIVDVCEMPFHTRRGGGLQKLHRYLYNRTFFRWFDAAIAISAPLERHVVEHGSRDIKVARAPVMVDTEMFKPSARPAAAPPAVVYCGLLNQEKDGVVSLMQAFASLASEMPDLRLILVGDAYRGSRIPEFHAIATGLGIDDKVLFVGNVPRGDVPGYLAAAQVLVLARPSSPQADAGMPTKVGEYLASGAPLVITRTGDIVEFLEDRVSAYLVPPDSVPALEEALRYVLLHPAEARAVGLEGREVAVRHFDYRLVGARLAAFVTDLRENAGTGAPRSPRSP